MTSQDIQPVGVVQEQVELARLLADASLLPEQYRKQPANILVAMYSASALGIDLMQAINGISVIKGKPAMSAELMRALVVKAGHRLIISEATDQVCRITVARREWPDDVQDFTYSWADAQRAGLATSDTWKRHPKAMLLARATSQACRAVFADVIAGMGHTPDELDDTPTPQRERPVIPRPPQPAPAPEVEVQVVDPVDGDQIKTLNTLLNQLEKLDGHSMDRDQRRHIILLAAQLDQDALDSATQLTRDQADTAITHLRTAIDRRATAAFNGDAEIIDGDGEEQ